MFLPWRLRTKTLAAGRIPLLMGVVNVTPDSFSDGGRFFEPAAASEHGLRLAAEGADVLDIGGQSTRPGAAPIAAEEELRRVLPVIVALCEQTGTPISIDTSSAKVAAECLAAGAEAINDVTALTGDPGLAALAASSGCGVCAMHMQGTPQTMQIHPRYGDVVRRGAGLAGRSSRRPRGRRDCPDRIALDPGIGFGKTAAQNLAILNHLSRYRSLGMPACWWASRGRPSSAQLIGDPAADRTAGTIGAAMAAARQGVEVLRVHDVAAGATGLAGL